MYVYPLLVVHAVSIPAHHTINYDETSATQELTALLCESLFCLVCKSLVHHLLLHMLILFLPTKNYETTRRRRTAALPAAV
jgi:hypothetical protein